ncbi:TRAP transporter small permease [Aestuariibacter sp. GS-14]|nr:TRAP transporter small permease [Aestuariibacter sp. GS-14]
MWAKMERTLTVTLLAAIVLLVLLAAVLRTIGYPVIWSVDVAQLLFVWLAVLAANQALREGAHARLDVLFNKLSIINRLRFQLCLNVISGLCLVCIGIFGFKLLSINPARTLGSTELPYAWVTAAIPAGALLMLVTICQQSRVLMQCLYHPITGISEYPSWLNVLVGTESSSDKTTRQTHQQGNDS